jgi:hypothetical protein
VTRDADGFVAIEWVAAVAFLLLPVAVLVATLPVWAERKAVASMAAADAARVLVADWPHADPAAVADRARDVARDHGVPPADVDVRILSVGDAPGSDARVEVTVVMPAIAVGAVRAGAWRYTTIAVRRIDDYRSR